MKADKRKEETEKASSLEKRIFWILTAIGYFISASTLYHVFRFLFQTKLISAETHLIDWIVNFLLILLFICQHSLMASQTFKDMWDNSGFKHLERLTYVLCTSLFLEILMSYWTTFPMWIVWSVDPIYHNTLFYLSLFGWILIFCESLLMDHLEIFGVKQVWKFVDGKEEPMLTKSEERQQLYKNYRHPIVIGLFIILWNTPIMTLDRFFLSVLLSIYPLVANNLTLQDILFVEQQLKFYFWKDLMDKRPRLEVEAK